MQLYFVYNVFNERKFREEKGGNMRLSDEFIYLLTRIKITKESKLPYLESFREYYNSDSTRMNLFWYLWFLDEKHRKFKRAVKIGYTGSFANFISGK